VDVRGSAEVNGSAAAHALAIHLCIINSNYLHKNIKYKAFFGSIHRQPSGDFCFLLSQEATVLFHLPGVAGVHP
jgi:hypothetical protein